MSNPTRGTKRDAAGNGALVVSRFRRKKPRHSIFHKSSKLHQKLLHTLRLRVRLLREEVFDDVFVYVMKLPTHSVNWDKRDRRICLFTCFDYMDTRDLLRTAVAVTKHGGEHLQISWEEHCDALRIRDIVARGELRDVWPAGTPAGSNPRIPSPIAPYLPGSMMPRIDDGSYEMSQLTFNSSFSLLMSILDSNAYIYGALFHLFSADCAFTFKENGAPYIIQSKEVLMVVDSKHKFDNRCRTTLSNILPPVLNDIVLAYNPWWCERRFWLPMSKYALTPQ